MSDNLNKQLKDATNEDILQLIKALSKGDETPQELAIGEMVKKVVSGKCAFRDVIGLEDAQMEALYAIGFNFYKSGRYEDAVKVFRGLCLFDQLEHKYWLGLGASLQITKKYEDALKAYSMAMIIKSTDPRAPFHAAECYIALNDRENAESALESVVAMGENRPESKAFVDKANTILKLLKDNNQAQ